MSKIVRIENGMVREIIPIEATIPNVAHWYGEEFALSCIEAPDEVEQNWIYRDGLFSAPSYEEPIHEETEIEILQKKVDELTAVIDVLLTGGSPE